MKSKPKHWYKIFTDECVLCGRGSSWRERKYTPKPKNVSRRYSYTQNACGCHF